MRPLKIALLSRSYWEENHHHDTEEGGAIQQLAEAVAALGHEVIVLSQSPQTATLKKVKIGALETWLSPLEKPRDFLTGWRDRWARKTYSHPKIYSDVQALRAFLARRGPFDVLWAQTEAPDGLVAAIAAQLGAKLPPVLVQIQALRQRFEKGTPVFIEKLPLGLAFRQATRLIAPSELIANTLPRYTGPGLTTAEILAKTAIVYPNLQRVFLRAAEEAGSWPEPMRDRVLFLGELNQRKGARIFLNALGKTETSARNGTFTILGDLTDPNPRFIRRWEELREATRRLLTGARMEFLGRVSSFEVIRQIKLARVVVVPSLFDPFGRGVVEALILGRPIITTDQVGSAPLVQAHECGLVIAPRDSEALAQAIDIALGSAMPYAENARLLAHRLMHEVSPEAIALQIAHHLSEIAAPAKTPN
jgi:glycosyltransferase involved in cell wall biosynthesis